MKRTTVFGALTLFLTMGSAMSAWGDFGAGRSAYAMGNYAKALAEFKADDSPMADYKVGYMYDHGEGGPQNPKAALEWYTKAANKGVAEAQYRLGLLYSSGYGPVEQDIEMAKKWYRKAAAQGFLPAKEALLNLQSGK